MKQQRRHRPVEMLPRDEERLESPEWHGEVLRQRAARLKQGKESFMGWETAKRQFRNQVK